MTAQVETLTMVDHVDEENSALARGIRLSRVRGMTNLSRRQIEEKYHIKAASLKSWETGRYNGLTVKGAKQIIQILQAEGIHCTLEWLLYGEDQGPSMQTYDDDTLFDIELRCFLRLYPEAKYMYCQDDALAPQIVAGELVAGLPLAATAFELARNQLCIIEQNDCQLIRYVLACDKGSLTLAIAPAPLESRLNMVINHRQVRSLTPVIWRRRHLLAPKQVPLI